MIGPSDRLGLLPPYAVAELAALKRRLLATGRDVIDLGAGDADFAPPAPAVQTLAEAAADPAMSRYAFQVGLKEYRDAASRYVARRFGVDFDPMEELLPLIGSKDGLAHLALAFVNPGDACVMPDPGYPAYLGGTIMAGGDPILVPLRPEHHYLVELGNLPPEQLDRVRLAYLNYPNNPTAAIAPWDYLERTVRICRERGILLAYDNPYCEITFDGYRAPSIFEIEGARECALEFHSLSKTFSMTGWRCAWVVGSADFIAPLRKLKTWIDTGIFLAVQKAGAAVLDSAEALSRPLMEEFAARRDVAMTALADAGLAADRPQATMYIWIPLPKGFDAHTFSTTLLEREGVVVLPGTAFGQGGEGFFRIALTVSADRLREAIGRIGRFIQGAKGVA